jgi:tetratricopeptide (TPR) repeat protein
LGVVLRSVPARRLLDGLLLLGLVVVAFLLGCYEMGDSDIWWHLCGGGWILEHGRVPGLDPFTFGSEDRVWVDIHWSYEVILALTYRAGGVGALVALGAVVGGCAFLAALSARRGEWPVAVTVLCWLPAFVLFGFRLDPRPEIFSLLYLACSLAVLWRVEDRPRLVWLLVPLQVLWVNAQGLFILGPILLGLFITAHAAQLVWRRLRGTSTWAPPERRWWLHVGGAALAVAAACLVNPYFLQGARFPFDLFPKVAATGNIYKRYIDELMSPRDYVQEATARVAGTNWFFLSFYFLLLLLPLSFLYPAAWRTWRADRSTGRRGATEEKPGTPAVWSWLGGLAAAVGLLTASTLTVSGAAVPGWVTVLGDNVPLAVLAGGVGVALLLRRRSPGAAVLAAVAAVALAAWMEWLRAAVLGAGRGSLGGTASPQQLALPLAVAGLAAGAVVLHRGGNLFRMLLALAFAYLSLQALQNWSRFALVAGLVLSWNFGEWAREFVPDRLPGRGTASAGWCLRGALAVALGVWVAALAADRYYVHTGEPRHFAFREEPLAFAHDAATFAGRPGLPERALVYGLDQTGVYDFHNAPRCKPFMDGRLEMPDRRTFETYVSVEDWLRQKDPRWQAAVAGMGNPLLLLAHQNNHASEALLLTHPGWRCVYYDALASVFVPDDAVDPSAFPAVDFAARHFAGGAEAPSVPNVPGAAAREEKALFNLAVSLPRTPESTWRWRVPVLLSAIDRGRAALREDPNRPDVWVLLGNCYWNLNPDLASRPPTPADGWALERGIFWAQATYALRRGLECQADNPAAWRYLFQTYRARGMIDCQAEAGERWAAVDPKVGDRERADLERLSRVVGRRSPPAVLSEGQVPGLVHDLVSAGRPSAAADVLDEASRARPPRWPWAFAEQAACLYMHLGRPADARLAWENAQDCPSRALRRCRVASTFWAEGDIGAALRGFEEARAADPGLAEACWGMAMLQAQRGDAGAARRACREGLALPLDDRQRSDLDALRQLLLPAGPAR